MRLVPVGAFASLDQQRHGQLGGLTHQADQRFAHLRQQVLAHFQHQFVVHLEAYLGSRASLAGVVLMMDIRHPLTEFDRMMLDWARTSGMPLHILLTKADKLAFGAAKTALLKVQKDVRQGWGDSISVQLFSAPKRQGIEEAQAVLARWLGLSAESSEEA